MKRGRNAKGKSRGVEKGGKVPIFKSQITKTIKVEVSYQNNIFIYIYIFKKNLGNSQLTFGSDAVVPQHRHLCVKMSGPQSKHQFTPI